MEALSTLWSLIMFIVGLFVFIAILNMESHIRKTNRLLRKLLSAQDPDRFVSSPTGNKVFDKETGKKI